MYLIDYQVGFFDLRFEHLLKVIIIRIKDENPKQLSYEKA